MILSLFSGFPTLLFFEGGKMQYSYPGDNKKAAILEFMASPSPEEAPKEPEEAAWKDAEDTEVTHLTDETFADFMAEEESVMVMFYAPW